MKKSRELILIGLILLFHCFCISFFQLGSLSLPDHWMKQFFLAHTYLELQLNEEAFRVYTLLGEKGFGHSTYVMAQIAVAYHNLRGYVTFLLKMFVEFVYSLPEIQAMSICKCSFVS